MTKRKLNWQGTDHDEEIPQTVKASNLHDMKQNKFTFLVTQLYFLLIAISLGAAIEAVSNNLRIEYIFRFLTLLFVNIEWLYSQSKSESIDAYTIRTTSSLPIFIIHLEVFVGVCSAFAGFTIIRSEPLFYYFVGLIFLFDYFVEFLSLGIYTYRSPAEKAYYMAILKATNWWIALDAIESFIFFIALRSMKSVNITASYRPICTTIIVFLFFAINYHYNKIFYTTQQ